jgi:hypothetical protein
MKNLINSLLRRLNYIKREIFYINILYILTKKLELIYKLLKLT